MTLQLANMMSSSNFFDIAMLFFVKFNYWSKFYVNIMTSSGVTTIFVYKGLTRDLEIWNTPIWVLPNIWRLGQVSDTKFGMNVSYKKSYWILQNAGITAFTISELLRENQQGKVT